MTSSTNLALPYLEGAQAQKHVTVNESLRTLDALVLLAVEDKDLTAPPGSPADGARYIPKATATGAWSGKENNVAHYVDGAWEFYAAREGFAAYVRDEDLLYVFNGTAWVTFDAALGPALITARTEDNAPDPTGDYGLSYDASASALKKVRLDRIGGAGKHTDLSANTTLDTTHCGRTVRVDATGGAIAITLPTSPATDDFVTVRKTDASANRVSVKVSSTDVAWLSAQYDQVLFAFWGGNWVAVSASIQPIVDVYTSSGTWTKPPLAVSIEALCIGGSGGGGSGRLGAAGSARAGGNGGVAGAASLTKGPASLLGSTASVTIGAGGTGGAAQSANDTNGNAGSSGGTSSLAGFARGAAGAGGNGGTTAAVTGSTSAGGSSVFGGSTAGSTSVSTAGTAGAASTGSGSGGAGGGITTGNAQLDAGAGGASSQASTTTVSGGNGGTSGGNGGNGANIASSTGTQVGGSGGGGGAGSTGGAGGTGGNGGIPGGGGGGGGAAVNGSTSGAGGNGARGEVRVTTYF